MAFPTGWSRRQPIVIQGTKIFDSFTDYTVRLFRDNFSSEICSPTDSNAAQADGGDIRFSEDAAGTVELSYDLIEWGQDSVHDQGDAVICISVKVPSMTASTNKTIYVWYKTTGTTVTTSGVNAYDASWVAYYPLSSNFNDRLGRYNLTAGNDGVSTDPTAGSGRVRFGVPSTNFDGGQIAYSAGGHTDFDVCPATMTAMYYPDVQDGNSTYYLYGCRPFTNSGRSGQVIALAANGAGVTRCMIGRGEYTYWDWGNPVHGATATVPVNEWQMWQFAVESPTATTSTYGFWRGNIDEYSGSKIVDLSGTDTTDDMTLFAVGGCRTVLGSNLYYVNGDMAHCETHATARSQAWMQTEFANINNPDTFALPGTPTAPLSGPPVNTVAPVISKVV